MYQRCTQIWSFHTKFYNGAWNVSANNSETVGHIDLRLRLETLIFNSKMSQKWCNIIFEYPASG